jgi:hypothetical protein
MSNVEYRILNDEGKHFDIRRSSFNILRSKKGMSNVEYRMSNDE